MTSCYGPPALCFNSSTTTRAPPRRGTVHIGPFPGWEEVLEW
jgi:hypothetical protein